MAGATRLLTPGGGGVVLTPASSIASDVTLNLPTTGVNNGTLIATDANGNLGLGVTPSAWGASNSGNIQLQDGIAYGRYGYTRNAYFNGTSWTYIASGQFATQYNQGGGIHTWLTAPSGTAGNPISFTQAMTLDASGNLLVGTTSAVSPLTVFATNNNNAALNAISIMRFGATYGSSLFHNYQTNLSGGSESFHISVSDGTGTPADNTKTKYEVTADGIHAWFGTSISTERMRIDSSGNFLFGKTVADDNTNAGFLMYGASSAKGVVTATMNNAGGQNTYHVYNQNATNNGYRFYVHVDGGISNYAGNNVNLSDERTKTNIELAGSYLDKICAIPVKLFNYKDEPVGEQRTLGVIAQDVEAIAPEFVNNDGFAYTGKDEAPLKAIYNTDMMFALMKAIQELSAQTTALKAELDATKAEIAALKGASV